MKIKGATTSPERKRNGLLSGLSMNHHIPARLFELRSVNLNI